MRKSQENTTVGTHAGGEKMAIWQRGDRYRRQNNDGEDWGWCKHSDACRRREMRSIGIKKKEAHRCLFGPSLEEIIASPVFATLLRFFFEERNDKSTYRQKQADRQPWSDSRNLISAKKKLRQCSAKLSAITAANHIQSL